MGSVAETVARMRAKGGLGDIANEIEEVLMEEGRPHLTNGIDNVEPYGDTVGDMEAGLVHAVAGQKRVGRDAWINEIETKCGETLWDVQGEMMGRIILVTLMASQEKGGLYDTCAVCLRDLEGKQWEMTLKNA